MNKAQLDEIALLCRKHKVTWQTGKDQEGYYLNIDINLTTSNYHLLKAIFEEYVKQNPNLPDVTALHNQILTHQKKKREIKENWQKFREED